SQLRFGSIITWSGSAARHIAVSRRKQRDTAWRMSLLLSIPSTTFTNVSTMNYRRLGESGVKLSEIGLGGWLTFNALGPEQGRAVMDKAFELGINFLDTADGYGRGKCEEIWGELLLNRKRSDFVLATKVYFPVGDGVNDKGLSRKHIME